jgi:hypothetical protein
MAGTPGIPAATRASDLSSPLPDVVTPRDFGGRCDGRSDDTRAIQRAIDWHGANSNRNNAGLIHIPGACLISSTLYIRSKGLTLSGVGWGNSIDAPARGFIRWNGRANEPMLKIENGFGTRIEDLRLVGNLNRRPSAALELVQSDGPTHAFTFIQRVWIGQLYEQDDDAGLQFENGVVFSGRINGDSNTLQHIRITGCAQNGLLISNPNASDTHLNGVFIQLCDVGIRTSASIVATNLLVTNSKRCDLSIDEGGKIQAIDFVSESSAKMCTFNGPGGRLAIKGTSWQAGPRISPDGNFIDTKSHHNCVVDLQDFELTFAMPYKGPVPKIRIRSDAGRTTSVTLRLIATRNIWPSNIDVGTISWVNDVRTVTYHPVPTSGQDFVPVQHVQLTGALGSSDRGFEPWRSDTVGKLNLFGGPLLLKRLSAPEGLAAAKTRFIGHSFTYQVTSISHGGESEPSPPLSVINGPLSGENPNIIQWKPVLGAVGYRVYGRRQDAMHLLGTIFWDTDMHPGTGRVHLPQFTDAGADITPTIGMPSTNRTGGAQIDGPLVLGSSVPGKGFQSPLILSGYSLWIDAAETLRVKRGLPTNDMDGKPFK